MSLPVESRDGVQSGADKADILQFRRNGLNTPLCAQCHTPMAMDRCEPELNSATIVATYRCRDCGLRDRAQIQ
jgi:hypothetical protein